jgi:hypothetical protein
MKESTAEDIAEALIADLQDRRGFRQVWDSMDEGVRREVRWSFRRIILETHAKLEEPAG